MAAPIFGFSQSFEQNANGIITGTGYGSLVRTNGNIPVEAADGSTYAFATEAGSGPFTRFGAVASGDRTEFVDGATTGVKFYLDTTWTANSSFQYTVASNRAPDEDGVSIHLRDFGFQVRSTGEETIEIGISNGATQVPLTSTPANAFEITESGWYTFQHVFTEVNGVLAVEMSLIAEDGTSIPLGTLSDPSDLIAGVGGVRYGWLTDVSLPNPGLAVDSYSYGNFLGQVDEVAEGAGEADTAYAANGTIPFLDADLLNAFEVSVAPQEGLRGTFTAIVVNPDGDGQGEVRWTFNATNADLDSLAADQTVVQTYTLTLTDGTTPVTQTVSVTLVGANDAPVANDDTLTDVAEDSGARIILASTLLGNDADVDANDILSITGVTGAVGGTVALNEDGDVVFTPTADFNGLASFTYTLSDGTTSDIAVASFNVAPVNDAPVANNDTLTDVAEDSGARVILASTLLANDTDVDTSDILSITEVTGAVGGTVALNGDGDIVFTPTADFNGAASFTYTLSDGTTTDTAVASFNVTPVNDAPVANNDTLTNVVQNSGARTILASTLLANDTDVDANDILSITGVTGAVGGTASLNGDGDIVFTPTADFNGAASFTYTLSDGTTTDTAVASFSITAPGGGGGTPPVTPPSTTPTAGPDNITGVPGQDNVIAAGEGADTVNSGTGNDSVFGNQGNDQLFGNQGNDTVFGGQGADSVYGGQGNDAVYGNVGNDIVYGNLGDDQVFGNEGDDQVFGNEGNDFVHGGQGNDSVYGGQGNDVLNGGAGDDVLQGGVGSDLFVFDGGQGADVVTDFRFGEGDRIDLRGQDYVLGQNNEGQATLFLEGGGTVVLLGLTPDQFQTDFVVA